MASHSLPIHALTVITEPALPVVFEAELELASDFAKASKAKSTQVMGTAAWINRAAGHACDGVRLSGGTSFTRQARIHARP